MNYGKIIRDAWTLTLENPKIKWFVFIPSFFAVFIFVLEVAWQVYLYFVKFEVLDSYITLDNISALIQFLTEYGLWGTGIVAIFFVLVFMFVIPPLVTAILILSVKHKCLHPQKELHMPKRMIDGLGHFFPMFELNAVTAIFSLVSIALFSATFLRYFDAMSDIFIPVILVYIVIAILVNLFLSFTPYYIAVDNNRVGKGIKSSAALVFLNMGPTLTIWLLMFLVGFRIVVNALIILGVPIGIIAAMTVFNNSTAFILSIFFSLGMIVLAAYITSLVLVFSTAVWYISFECLKEKQKELSEEEDEE